MGSTLKACWGPAALALGTLAQGALAEAPGSHAQASPGAHSSPPTQATIVGPVLMVSDLERSLRFYTQGLGLTVFKRLPPHPGPGAVLVAADKDPPPHILIRQVAAEPGAPGSLELGNGLSRIMLTVADAAAVAERLRNAGYPPDRADTSRLFFVTDPDGYRYEVIQTAGPR